MQNLCLKIIVVIFLCSQLLACSTQTAQTKNGEPSSSLYAPSPVHNLSTDELFKLADAGDAKAQNELGVLFGTGERLEKDSKKSFHYYELAAQQGLAVAQTNLAFMYYQAQGTERNLTLARDWFYKSAVQGHFAAQYALGRIYALGEGTQKNISLAEQWFLLSANQGYVDAQQALIYFYTNEKIDSKKAVLWTHRVRDANLFGQVWKSSEKPKAINIRFE